MTYLRANLPPVITLVVCLGVFGYLTWICLPPFPDMGLFVSVIFCIRWAQARNDLIQP